MTNPSRSRHLNRLILLALLSRSVAHADAPPIELPATAASDPAALARAMPKLALAVARTAGADAALRMRAQLVAGDVSGALATLTALRAPPVRDASPRIRARFLPFLLYAHARAAARPEPFDAAYRDAFHQTITPLDDETAAIAVNNLSFDNLGTAQAALNASVAALHGKTAIDLAQAAQLVHDYGDVQTYRALAAATPALLAEDDQRRYTVERDVVVRTRDGATICTLVVRPRHASKLPGLLQFTIYNDPPALMREARRSASHGYAGVIGLTPGKGCSPGTAVPYEHGGADAAGLIEWIAAQPWSDGRVGMYGGSYSGFMVWAAAGAHPGALKAIMAGAPVAPGIDVPMEHNVPWNFIYPWPFYTTDNKTLDSATYDDRARWARLDRAYYTSGRAYRDLDKIDGRPNPIFDTWVAHPGYDAYWRALIPYQEQFRTIDIPVLQTAGYYAGGPGAAVYYFTEHTRYRPDAEHYLVVGPYDHLTAQRGTPTADGDVETIAGYKLDPAARTDLVALRYAWFDHVLRGGPKPAMLADRVNYEVMGADLWRHARSLDAMSNRTLRYHLADGGRLDPAQGPAGTLHQIVDFADRSDAGRDRPGGDFEDKALDATNGLVFATAPFTRPTELSGLFSGRLAFTTNKRDFDFQISLYEQTAQGDYIQLAPYWARASFVRDPSHRHLLTPGAPEQLEVRSVRLMSRLVAAGSRLVAVLQVLKEPGREINYGTGRDVAGESIADAGAPLQISWSTESYLDLPSRE